MPANVRGPTQTSCISPTRDATDDQGALMNIAAVPWWQKGILYQIYPRSFQDSNGDGIGDIGGIISRLPYLRDLSVDAIWLSPIFPSPMADFGYDISNYFGVDPIFGTLDDFDTLVAAAHAGNLKVILDLVPNHTSDQLSLIHISEPTRLGMIS